MSNHNLASVSYNPSNPLERVRLSTRRVVQQAQLVRLDLQKLRALADSYDLAAIRQNYQFEADFHFLAQGEAQANYVVTLDALNFGSGLSPRWKEFEAAQLVQGSLYKTVADTLRREAEAGNPLDARFAAEATPSQLATMFGIPADFELLQMFAASLNELGQWVINQYSASYVNLIEATDFKAAGLVELLGANLKYFDDQAIYKPDGLPVYFYKRAQILANDLYLAFEGKSWGAFADIEQLTMFADNLLPHYFRMEGVLSYEPSLEQAIEAGEYLPAGSTAEVELRANAVQCVEIICQYLRENQPGQIPIFPAQLDSYLWNYSQSRRIKSRPRHRTITYFY